MFIPIFTVLDNFTFFKSIRAEGSLGRAHLELQVGSESHRYRHPGLAITWQYHSSPPPKYM